MTYLVIPGRHHTLTNFQHDYLKKLCENSLQDEVDVHGNSICNHDPISHVIFPITSSNHQHTRRNPLPLHLRAMAIEHLLLDFPVPGLVFAIPDVGVLESTSFAEHIIKQISFQSEGTITLTPENTIVVCSTPEVIAMYNSLGFTVLPAELKSLEPESWNTTLPWEVVQHIGTTAVDWREDSFVTNTLHASSLRILKTYNIGDTIRRIFNDPVLGDDGDITETRDYSLYVRQMDEIAELKWKETKPFVQPGRVGDIGCAVGSWIFHAAKDRKLNESDFYGIEIARTLLDICEQRKERNEFGNPNVFFGAKNAFTKQSFENSSMNTIHSGSLTHEVFSYVSQKDVDEYCETNSVEKKDAYSFIGLQQLKQFITFRYRELATNGVWINRDVVGPENPDQLILLHTTVDDGSNEEPHKLFDDKKELKEHLSSLSTYSLFLRFAKDFRKDEKYSMHYEIIEPGKVKLRLQDACEFVGHKDYTDNWDSEMHERYYALSFSEWKALVKEQGFAVDAGSHTYLNPWIVEHRFNGIVQLTDLDENKIHFPDHTMILIGRKIK